MRQRCFNSTCRDYPRYGGRGITICEQWNDFVIFRDWALASGYQEGLTIDRIDNDKEYSPDNCRWILRVLNIGKDAGKTTRKPVNQYDLMGNLVASYSSAREAARRTGFSQGNISAVCRGEEKQTHGFIWSYND